MVRIVDALPVVWSDGDNIEARTEMIIGQFQAGKAFGNSSVALVHGMARPQGHNFTSHTVSRTVSSSPTSSSSTRWLHPRSTPKYPVSSVSPTRASPLAWPLARPATASNNSARTSPSPTTSTTSARSLPRGVPRGCPQMTQDAFDSGSPANNPRKPTRQELENLFVTVYDDALAPDSSRRS